MLRGLACRRSSPRASPYGSIRVRGSHLEAKLSSRTGYHCVKESKHKPDKAAEGHHITSDGDAPPPPSNSIFLLTQLSASCDRLEREIVSMALSSLLNVLTWYCDGPGPSPYFNMSLSIALWVSKVGFLAGGMSGRSCLNCTARCPRLTSIFSFFSSCFLVLGGATTRGADGWSACLD